jgi:autotransporter-associated beta strand protein
LSKTGNGVLTISGSNTYSGGTSINAGVLQINSSASLGGASGSAAITSGTLQALNTIDTTRNFQLSGSTSTISVDNNAVYTISGTVNDGAGVGSLTKSGSGTLVLTASNGYTGGTLVAAGKLNVNGSISGSTTVSSDATIGGTGTVADVNILAGGKFAPGASIGTLTGTSLVWNSNSTASALFELSNVDNTSDSLSLSGTFSKGTGTSFVFDFQNSGFSNGVSPTVYTLASFASTTFSQGNFSFVNLGPGLAGNFILTSNVLQFSVVPEPETWALLAGATGFLWVRRRFRKR